MANLKKGLAGKAELVDCWQAADAVMIVSCTMTERSDIQQAKAAKKKIIFRIDNMPKDSRNRGTAFSRMRDFGQMADVIVFQSEWAKDYVGSWLAQYSVRLRNSKVIYNGIDSEFFYHRDDPKTRGENYVFCTFNTDENKRFPEAAYDFYLRNRAAVAEGKPQPKLTIVGQYGDKLREYNFDFFNKEKIKFVPPVEDRKTLGKIFREHQYMYFPAFADASPNTVAEGVACGCEILLPNSIGGTHEVIRKHRTSYTIYDMAQEYLETV